MRFEKFSVGLLTACALSGLSAAHAASPAVTLTPDPAYTFNGGRFSLGFEFTTNSAITVSSLGYFTTER